MDGASVPHPVAGQRDFAELVCADPAWVRAEFDAIIDANFGAARPEGPTSRPPHPDREHPGDAGRPLDPLARATRGDLARTARRVGARERSPPPPDIR